MTSKSKYYFINPPSIEGRKLIRCLDCATESKGNYLFQPYDFLLLSSKIESNEIVLLDAIAEKITKEHLFLKIKDPKIIVVSMADNNWQEDFDFIKEARIHFSDIPILVFGDSFLEEAAVLQIKDHINGIITNPLLANLQNIFIKNSTDWISNEGFYNNSLHDNPNLKTPTKASLGTPKHELFLNQSYRWPFSTNRKYTTVFTSWGCPYSCSYCSLSKFPNFYRESHEIIEELKYIKKLGIKEIYIGDQSFGTPKDNIVSLLSSMIENRFNFSWSSFFHPNQYSEKLLELMKKSGCHTIIIGIESHNLKGLKKYGRNVQLEKINSLIQHAKKLKIHVCGDFMIGLPNESKEDILKTIKFSIDLDLDYASFNIAAPHPGSQLRTEAIKDGRMTQGNAKHFDSFGHNNVLGNGVLNSSEIIRLRNQAVKSFYLRPRYLLKSIFRISSFEHLMIQVQEMFQIILKTR